jgi:sugar phosphate isomerase/epimerase
MRLSCPDYTWPSLPHAAALDLIRALEFPAVDLGFMAGRSHIRPEAVAADPAAAGERVRGQLEQRGLAVADVFAIPAADFQSRAVNNPDPAARAESLEFFGRAVRFARAAGAPGLTTLPGVVFPGEGFDDALARSADGLRHRVDLAALAGLALSVEPHAESLIDTPGKTRQLLDLVPGLQLTLDHAHYVYGGARQADIDALLGWARHLQCRPGRPGQLQVRVVEDAIDFENVVALLLAQGYEGCLAVEYVWQDWLDCNRIDTVGETALMRDRLRAALSRHAASRGGQS